MASAFELVELTRSATALRLALANPGLRPAALGNPDLPARLWFEAYPAKPKVAAKDADVLVRRPLAADQLDHVIATETRTSVLGAALAATAPSPAQLDALLGTKALSRSLTDALVDRHGPTLDLAWLRAAGDRVGGSARLEYYLRAGSTVPDTEVSAALEGYAAWGREWDNARLHQLLAARPAVLPGAARSDQDKVRTVAAGCRFLTDPALQRVVADLDNPELADPASAPKAVLDAHSFTWVALVCNPTCDLGVVAELEPLMLRLSDYESCYRAQNRLSNQPYRVDGPFEEVSDPQVLAWLLRRTLPSKYRSDGRPVDLPALLANPNLGAGEAWEILGRVGEHPHVASAPGVLAGLLALLERFPGVGVEHAVTEQGLRDWAAAAPDAGPEQGRVPEPPSDARCLTEAAATAVSALGYNRHRLRHVAAYLDATLAEDPAAWSFVFRMLDQPGFAGTVADLAQVANATAA